MDLKRIGSNFALMFADDSDLVVGFKAGRDPEVLKIVEADNDRRVAEYKAQLIAELRAR